MVANSSAYFDVCFSETDDVCDVVVLSGGGCFGSCDLHFLSKPM